MKKLGVSVYPERSTYEKDAAYLELAAKYGYKRVFTSLLQINGDQEEVVGNFKRVIAKANALGMEVMVDMNPALFAQLGVSYDDLSFFHDLGAYGVRLDEGFSGLEEARMTRNPYNLKIEINMSQGTPYVDNIMTFSPNRENLMGSHNFYPRRYTGLSVDYFNQATAIYTKYRLNTAAFINAPSGTFGAWPVQDGMCTIEDHRTLPIETQVAHYKMLDTIDDLLIANAYASEAELKAAADEFNAPEPGIHVELTPGISAAEEAVVFAEGQTYRGDHSAYQIRSTNERGKQPASDFPAHHTETIKAGDLLIDNVGYNRYAGGLQIALKPMVNDGRVNVVGRILPEEMFLLESLKPWAGFRLVKANH